MRFEEIGSSALGTGQKRCVLTILSCFGMICIETILDNRRDKASMKHRKKLFGMILLTAGIWMLVGCGNKEGSMDTPGQPVTTTPPQTIEISEMTEAPENAGTSDASEQSTEQSGVHGCWRIRFGWHIPEAERSFP